MLFTTLLSLIFVSILVGSILIQAQCLLIGLRWAKAEEATFRASLWAIIISSLVSVCIYLVELFTFKPSILAYDIAFFAIQIGLWLYILRLFFGTSILRSVQASLPLVLVPIGALLAIIFLFQPFVAESYVVPTNAMSPTIVGEHQVCVCELCGSKAYAQVLPPGLNSQQIHQDCICDKFHITKAKNPSKIKQGGDRVISAKFLRAGRWELATFRYPKNPDVIYAMRVVGLPGETIHIEDNGLYVNGQRRTPPEHLKGIEYRESVPGMHALHGTKENPVILAEDEYFVLGDFTDASLDSRFWTEGAPGHNPYAVPESYMTGVITTIYWPPERLRSFK